MVIEGYAQVSVAVYVAVSVHVPVEAGNIGPAGGTGKICEPERYAVADLRMFGDAEVGLKENLFFLHITCIRRVLILTLIRQYAVSG